MYYLKCFILYSFLGFVLESVVYKVSGSPDHSSVLLGPYTLVYGFGGLVTVLINDYFLKINMNIILKYILLFVIFTIVCSTIEAIIGNLIHLIFKFDKWNYLNHKFPIGKYTSLDYALIWGLLATSIMYFLKPFFDKVLSLIPNNTTIFIFSIIIIDLIYTLISKAKIT